MSAHTPGPWKLHFWSENIGVGSDRPKPRECEPVALLARHIENGSHNDRALRAEADARLIAAAPDLLEIAQRYVDSADECIRGGDADPEDCDCVACDLTRSARAAIKKARGA